ncbi:VOC family protein [Ferrimonas aestuarii]|uniref:VOC family protein n=1 Tax=Ferrimonas aestuarii TaxID=2569539 RepID=A0A4U1BM20_9GAMM|nr:VOC family protein [Ferrimonas aestuarii]TKB53340.1 VOC family protein [Ferrimonas aestuarii]
MSSPFTTHGAVSWHELSTSDPVAAKAFYGQVFGWQFETKPMPQGDYEIILIDDEGIGGIMKSPDPHVPTAWTGYVTVDDIDAVASKVTELGGKVLFGPEDIPEVGRFCWIQDPQGAVIAAITYLPM